MIHFYILLAFVPGFFFASTFGVVSLLVLWLVMDAWPNMVDVLKQRIEMVAPLEENFENHHPDAEHTQWINQILETVWKKIVIWMNVKLRPILNKNPPIRYVIA